MYIAKQKRRENIAEYILYLWQIEDLIRALGFDMQRLYQVLVAPQAISDEQKQSLFYWYEDMANMLITEGKREQGHVAHIQHLIADIHDMHLRLLAMPIGRDYKARFSLLEPHLIKLRSELKDSSGKSDSEVMFMALYSVVLLRLKGEDKSSHITDVMELVSPVVALLADYYRKVEQGEIDLFKED